MAFNRKDYLTKLKTLSKEVLQTESVRLCNEKAAIVMNTYHTYRTNKTAKQKHIHLLSVKIRLIDCILDEMSN